jgi:hypothetical protein
MNHLNGVDRVANRFSIMRHAQSKANTGQVIPGQVARYRY